MDELVKRLRESVTYRSLKLETKVRDLLRELGWEPAHGAFYNDITTGQEREFDLAATRTWIHKRRNVERVIRLTLLAECKSMRDGNVLVAVDAAKATDRAYHHWFGLDEDSLRSAIHATLAQGGVPRDDIERVMERFARSAYPSGRAEVMPFLANAHRAPLRASAAYEVRGEKNDDHNFVWNATRQVFSALASVTRELLASDLDEVDFEIRASSADALATTAAESLSERTAVVHLFHPVIVTDARLWTENMKPVEWCRVEHARIGRPARRWIDLVNAEALESYANSVTESYGRWFAKLRAEEVTKRAE